MSDRIRYALGWSARGDFIAAMSDRGLVAFELCIGADTAVDNLVARFPDAIVEEDVAGLATTVATLSRAVSSAVSSAARKESAEDPSLALGIVASTNRLVRRNGSLAGGRACAASVAAASRQVLPRIPKR